MNKPQDEVRCRICGSADVIKKRRKTRQGKPVIQYQCKRCLSYFTYPPKEEDIIDIIDHPDFPRLLYEKKANERTFASKLYTNKTKLSRIIYALSIIIPDPLEVISKLGITPETMTAIIDITTLISRRFKLKSGREFTLNLYAIVMQDSKGNVVGWDITLSKDVRTISHFLYRIRRTLGYDPAVIVRDRSREEARAIELVYPNSAQQLCCWHLLHDVRKLPSTSLLKSRIRQLLQELYGLAKQYGQSPIRAKRRSKRIVEELEELLKMAEIWDDRAAAKFLKNLLADKEYLAGFLKDIESRPDLQKIERFFGVIKTRIQDFVPRGKIAKKMSLGEWLTYLRFISHLIIFCYVLDKERKSGRKIKISDLIDTKELLRIYHNKLRVPMPIDFHEPKKELSDEKQFRKSNGKEKSSKFYQRDLKHYGFKVFTRSRRRKIKRKTHTSYPILSSKLDTYFNF